MIVYAVLIAKFHFLSPMPASHSTPFLPSPIRPLPSPSLPFLLLSHLRSGVMRCDGHLCAAMSSDVDVDSVERLPWCMSLRYAIGVGEATWMVSVIYAVSGKMWQMRCDEWCR